MPTGWHDDINRLSIGGRLSFDLSVPPVGATRISDLHHACVAWNLCDVPWIYLQCEIVRMALHSGITSR